MTATKMTAADEAAIRAGVRVVLNRRLDAFDAFALQIAEAGAGAEYGVAVAKFYLKIKAAKFDGTRYTVKHGAFLDADVIVRAVAEASK